MRRARRPHAARVLDAANGAGAMTGVLSIMLFLTVLAAALGLATWGATRSLDRQLAGRMTVQVAIADPAQRDAAAARATALLRASRDVAAVRPVDRAALARLLSPWLGSDGADPELPMPALIDVDLADPSDATLTRVRSALARAVPAARIDAHEAWMSPVSGLMRFVTLLAVALVLLMAGATAAVVVLATRAGLEAHRPTIEVMHMLGSTDVQVARLFQRRIARDALVGGAIGGATAILVVVVLGIKLGDVGSDLLSAATLGGAGWVALALLPLLFVGLAALSARIAVTAVLRRTL
ncbi:Permease [Sphingomonas sp. EC-HK361]|uniref:cell division protein FtsX n=1 Tax=Sphingomonas sp. EC-HK361 TaxID=2038397 RepID=UPI00125AE81D|nr:permease [Sphingomonas sp. EC-HK361]VVS98032.1 Permease [Sphingomonas sp. EC-HK361]